MVDTAIFSIFHRAPPPPRPEPIETAVPPPAPPEPAPVVVHHPEPPPEPVVIEPPSAPVVAQKAEPLPEPPPEPVAEAAPHVHVDAPPAAHLEPPEYHEPAPQLVPPEHAAPPVEPERLEPEPAALDYVEPAPLEPEHVEPEPTEPQHVGPVHVEPEHAEPALAAPAHLGPTQAEPEHAEPQPVELPHVEPEPVEPQFFEAGRPELQLVAEPDYGEPDYAEPEYPPAPPPPVYVAPEHPDIEPPAPDLAYEPAVEPPVEPYAEPTPLPSEAPIANPVWVGPAALSGIPLEADQLGLANPIIITLLARLRDSAVMELDASQSGMYRPQLFRPAPWSGFAYDQAGDGRTGVAAGTRILTSRGELEVERLLPGDSAMSLREPALLPIAWIGRSIATAPPIWIEAGALGPNLPRRGLCLAPEQPVYLEPVPVPAERLVNGTTIRQLPDTAVDMFHIDVGHAEILFAEGVPLSSSDRVRVQTA